MKRICMIAALAIALTMAMNAQDVIQSGVLGNSTVEAAQQRTADIKASVEAAKDNAEQAAQAHQDAKTDIENLKRDLQTAKQ